MDIPLPDLDELELLEANYNLLEDQPHSPSPEPPYQTKNRLPSPIPTPKRTRPIPEPEEPHPLLETDDIPSDKRCRLSSNDDEDWLRYSPPPPPLPEEEKLVEQETILSRYVSDIDGEFFPVTAPSGGDRVYAKMCRVEIEERKKKLNVKSQSNNLISEPVKVLLQKLEQEAFTKALQASSEIQDDEILPDVEVVHDRLWVDKYAPNSFTELLSDEQTNREVLLWLKQWDSCVFGLEIRSTSDEVLTALRRHSSTVHHPKYSDSAFTRKRDGPKWSNGNWRRSNSSFQENGDSKVIQDYWKKKSMHTGPPEQKVLLLCGPPGLGKTTLAHVAAKHCGYRVVEVNASDDRSSASIEKKILGAIEMKYDMSDLRPQCLVIDEIDGALGDGKGVVEVILKMVTAEKSSSGKENISKGDKSGKTSSKRGQKAASLSRPVICICNDLYAPSLRSLRQIAKVHVFVQPTVSRVVSRLKYICSKEGMKTNAIALTALAEYTECDIRSCLNTLQFLNKKKECLKALDIGSQVVGQKDMTRNTFDIWKEIFQTRKMKRERKCYGSCGGTSDFDFLLSLVSYRGDFDVILDGIHENILQLSYHDPMMQKTVRCFDAFGISDILNHYMMRTQKMALMAYQPPLVITIHHLISQVQKPNIEWPKSYQRYRTSMTEKVELLTTWQNKLPSFISRHLSITSFVEDTISHLIHILSPPTLKPVAMHLMSEKEKDDFAKLVGTMVSYSISYKNVKSNSLLSQQENEIVTDAAALSFDPPLSDFVNFKGYNSGYYVLPIALKQILVHEVEKQKILQASRFVDVNKDVNKASAATEEAENSISKFFKRDKAPSVTANAGNAQSEPDSSGIGKSTANSNPSTISSSKPKSSKGSAKPSAASFFDRFRKQGAKNTTKVAEESQTAERDSRPLLFKFNEGFTNAVKRSVKMRDFLS